MIMSRNIFDLPIGAYFVFVASPHQVAKIISNNGFKIEYEYVATQLSDGSRKFTTETAYEVKEMQYIGS